MPGWPFEAKWGEAKWGEAKWGEAKWGEASGVMPVELGAGDGTIAGLLRVGARVLAKAGIENPRLESRLLLAHGLGRTTEDLTRDLTAAAEPSNFASLIARRAAREPLAFILGWREFWSLQFRVSPATLIPRPDSETVIGAALAFYPDHQAPLRVLDLGTGTGCLLLAFLHERPFAFGVGVDRSESAARLAGRNAGDLGLAPRSAFLCGDWAASISGRFDLVLSNPPYVATPELATLMPEVGSHEPRIALDGGNCGLTAYRAIIGALMALLTRSGAAVLELGAGQSGTVAEIAEDAGFQTSIRPDLSGIARAMILHASP
jgi:release factor glutamine methyltransferase